MELREDGANNAETCKGNVRLFVSSVFFGAMKEACNCNMYLRNCKTETSAINAVSQNCMRYFYEFYINCLRKTELSQNMLPQ